MTLESLKSLFLSEPIKTLITYSIRLSKAGHTNRMLTQRQNKLAKIVFQNIRDQLQLILCETQFFIWMFH